MTITPSSSQNLRVDAAASYLGISVSALAKMRMRGDGPPFVKLGRRVVIYRMSDLAAWLDQRQRLTTAD
jgi:predicted DNA-binding transcriptional regulator AlpA